jgi:NitT/TauT family transport system substrate-binding protein
MLRMLRSAALTATLALGLALAGAGLPVGAQDAPPSPVELPAPGPGTALVPLTVGLGYIPNVQFAQFYLADQRGYYREAGLDVTFQNKPDPELITLLGQGAVDIGLSDGTSLIAARSQGIPVRYGATVYARFPNVVYTKASSGIESVADLAGKRLGTPGRFGSSWVMLQALLASEGLTTEDLEIVVYPDFGQGVALAAGQVDAATGFANNEPVQLRLTGEEVVVLTVDEVAPLPGPGLTVGEGTLATKSDAARAFTCATLRAMEEIVTDPQHGLDATFARVPELASNPEAQRAILEATVAAWQSPYTDAEGLGAIDRDTWVSALAVMTAMPDSTVATPVEVDDLVTDELRRC